MSDETESKVPGHLLGVTDFFSILMPGGLLAFLLKDVGKEVFSGITILPKLEGEIAKWLAFAVAAYFLGHLLHHVGGILDSLYDLTYKKCKEKADKAHLLGYAKDLISSRYQLPGRKIMVGVISNFSWARSYVNVRSEAAARELERGGADSKFFRSLCLVSLVAVALFSLYELHWWPLIISAALFLFSLWRFFDLRWKNSQATYEYFIILCDLERLSVHPKEPNQP